MTKRATRATDLPRAASRQRPRPAARRPSWKRRLKTFVALAILLVETVIAAVLACSLIVFQRFSHTLPNVEELSTDIRPPVATTIWSQDGVLLGQLDVENRQPITLDDMPSNLVNATIAIEDHRFYEHKGVDLQGIARAAFANFTAGHARGQGGSTLTQQLVRNVGVFGVTKEKSYSRKIREALIAMRMEQVYSKREILALYLNNIYYGGGAYGVQAAAKTYFGKSAYKLDLSEAALLAGLPQRPSAFSPFEHRSAALKRRDEVIDSMLRYKQITADQADEAKTEDLHFMPQQRHKDFNFKAPHFVWYVLNDLFRRYGPSYVYSGLHIDTTLNWKMQQVAEAQLEHGLQASQHGNQGALVSLDNANGYIRALVGGRNFRASQYNNVTQGRRQCGSTFKLFDYTAAFNEGKCDIYSTFEDRPIPYPNDHRKVVKNFGGTYHYAPISCLSAIQWSVNTIAVQAAQTVGIGKVIEYAHKMGITTELKPVLPTALGASEVRPLDLCSAYSLMADKGVRFHPMSLIRVIDADGNVLEENAPVSEPSFLKPHTIEQMEQGLEAVVTGGSGTRARGDQRSGIVEGAHGKTGTTSDSRDAWFAGYTPELTTVIWVASVHHNKHGVQTYEPMEGSTGGQVCAPIWHDFMIKAVPEERKYRQALQQLESRPAQPQTAAAVETPKKLKTNEHPAKTGAQPQSVAPAGDGATPLWNSLPDSSTKPDTGANPATAPGGGATDGEAKTGAGTPAPGTAPAAQAPPSTPTIAPPVTGLPSQNGGPRANPLRNDSVAGAQPVAPPHPVTPRTAAPPPTAAPEIVEVTLCVDSGKRATPWCPATNTVRMTKQQAARLGRCRMHTPPPGEH